MVTYLQYKLRNVDKGSLIIALWLAIMFIGFIGGLLALMFGMLEIATILWVVALIDLFSIFILKFFFDAKDWIERERKNYKLWKRSQDE
jgi:uncharacterized membrane protein